MILIGSGGECCDLLERSRQSATSSTNEKRGTEAPRPARSPPLVEVPVTHITVVDFGIGYPGRVLENTLRGNRDCSLNLGG